MEEKTPNNFASDSILYYPTIEFQSETWVKSALTFWNKIYRIVPMGYKPNDSDEIVVAKSNGFIEDVEISNSDLKKTARDFENFCEKLKWYPDGFDSTSNDVSIHSDKIDDRLRPFFKQFSEKTDKKGFYKLPEKIANGYMFFLSDTISKRRNIPKLTDSKDMFAAMTYFDGNGDFEELFIDSDANYICSNLIIENLLPADIESINMKRIIDLNQNLKQYKNEFRKIVADFSNKLSKIEDHKFAISEVMKFKKSLLENKHSRIEMLKTYYKELLPSLLYIGIPTCTSSIVGSLYSSKDDIFGIAEIGKGLFIGGIAALANTGKDLRKNWSSNKSTYYLELSKVLISPKIAKINNHRIVKLFDEFIND